MRIFALALPLSAACGIFFAETAEVVVRCAALGDRHRCSITVDDEPLFDDEVTRAVPEVWTTSGFNGTAGATYARVRFTLAAGGARVVDLPVRCDDMAALNRAVAELDPLPANRSFSNKLRCARRR